MADAKLLAQIQDTLDQIDLKVSRDEAKRAMDAEQQCQKKRFDMRRYKPPKYDTGDVVMVMASPAATGESRKLATVARGPFKVTAVLPNDRYKVQDMRDLKKSPNRRIVLAVDAMKRWVTFDATFDEPCLYDCKIRAEFRLPRYKTWSVLCWKGGLCVGRDQGRVQASQA